MVAVVDVRTGESRTLALPTALYDYPAVSPDGSELALVVGNAEVAIANLRTSQIATIATLPDSDISGLSWSPDGQQIVFGDTPIGSGSDSPTPRVELVSALGGTPRVLTAGGGPAWSPNGQWISFVRDNGVWLMKPDGSDARLIAPGGWEASWTPGFGIHACLRVLSQTDRVSSRGHWRPANDGGEPGARRG